MEDKKIENQRIELLAHESVVRAIFKLSIPMIMGMMVQVLYNLVDTYFIGLLGDANQLASANMALPVFVILMGIASMIGTGASSYISRCLGSKDFEQANKTLSMAVVLLGGIGLFITIIGVVFCNSIVRALGAQGATYTYTYHYVLIMIIGGLGVMGNFAFGQLLRAEGNAVRSMMGMMIGTVLNLILDPVFIFLLDLGVTGAALATVIGNGVGCLYYILCFVRGKTTLKLYLRGLKINTVILKEILKIGLPSSLSQILMGGATVVTNHIGLMYGTETVAGMGIATKIMMIGTFIFIGFSAGCQPLIGYNYGAKNFERVKLILNKAMQLTAGIGIGLWIIFTMTSTLLVRLFIEDQAVINQGTLIFKALIVSLPFLGSQMIATAAAQSMGKAMPSMVLSICRQGVLYVPLILVLHLNFGFYGFIYAQAITDGVMFLIAQVYIRKIIAKEVDRAVMSVKSS